MLDYETIEAFVVIYNKLLMVDGHIEEGPLKAEGKDKKGVEKGIAKSGMTQSIFTLKQTQNIVDSIEKLFSILQYTQPAEGEVESGRTYNEDEDPRKTMKVFKIAGDKGIQSETSKNIGLTALEEYLNNIIKEIYKSLVSRIDQYIEQEEEKYFDRVFEEARNGTLEDVEAVKKVYDEFIKLLNLSFNVDVERGINTFRQYSIINKIEIPIVRIYNIVDNTISDIESHAVSEVSSNKSDKKKKSVDPKITESNAKAVVSTLSDSSGSKTPTKKVRFNLNTETFKNPTPLDRKAMKMLSSENTQEALRQGEVYRKKTRERDIEVDAGEDNEVVRSKETLHDAENKYDKENDLRKSSTIQSIGTEVGERAQEILSNIEAAIISSSSGLDVKAFLTNSFYAYPAQSGLYCLQAILLAYRYCLLKDQKKRKEMIKESVPTVLLSSTTVSGASISVAGLAKGSSGLVGLGNVISGGAGGAAGLLSLYLESRHLANVREIGKRLELGEKKYSGLVDLIKKAEGGSKKIAVPFDKASDYIKTKIGHKKIEGGTSVVISVAGVAGSTMQILIVAAVLGTAATGIGAIALAATATAAGIGMGAGKWIRREVKRSRLDKDAVLAMLNKMPGLEDMTKVPDFIKTTNDAIRFVIAWRIYLSASFSGLYDPTIWDYDKVYGVYFGKMIYGPYYHQKVLEDDILGIMGRLKDF